MMHEYCKRCKDRLKHLTLSEISFKPSMRSTILDDTRLTCSLHLQLQRKFLCQPVYAKIINALQYALYSITL